MKRILARKNVLLMKIILTEMEDGFNGRYKDWANGPIQYVSQYLTFTSSLEGDKVYSQTGRGARAGFSPRICRWMDACGLYTLKFA